MIDRAFQRTLNLLDRLAPARGDGSPEFHRQGQLLAAAVLVGVVILGATSVTTLTLADDPRGQLGLSIFNLVWCGIFASLLVVLRLQGSHALVANGLVGVAFIHTFLLSSLVGGRNTGALFAFSIYPLLAVLLAGWRSGLVFTGLSAAAIVLTPLVPTTPLMPSFATGAAPAPVLIRDALNVTVAIGLFSAMYDAARSITLREARSARDRAERGEAAIRSSLDAQAHLLDLAKRFQDATGSAFDRELDRALEYTTQRVGADRAVLRLVEGRDFVARYTYSEDDVHEGIVTPLANEAEHEFAWSGRQIADGQTIHVADTDELPAEAKGERALFEARNVRSWLCVPVRAERRAVGYLSLERIRQARAWSEQEVSGLRLLAELIASAVLRERMEKALRDSEEKFAIAFRDHPDAMVISDLETDVVLECNSQWLREVAAADRSDVIGNRLWDFGFQFPEEKMEVMRQMLRERGQTPAVETEIIGRLGDLRTYLISATRIELNGRACVLANAHDLTDHKSLEQQLLHSQKMEAVGRLAGGIAHDFNNMLTVISGYSTRLANQLEGEMQRDAKEIRAAADRSAALTRQLLAFSRRQVLRTEPIDPGELLRGLENMMGPLVGDSIELVLEIGDDVGLVRADRGQLEQAIVNLALNARDAMPDGGTLTLSTRRVDITSSTAADAHPPELSLGSYVVLRVEDDGEGIQPEDAKHVMEPFYTTKPEGEGTGLGLAMVHGIARQCDGALRLDSEPGRGTRAEIFLPVAAPASDTARPPARPSGTAAPGARRTILLAEDEPRVRHLTAQTLRGAGYEVVEAEDGANALALARQLGHRFDMLVSDVVMPNMSGTELSLRLREENPDLPVLLMSGYPEPPSGGHPIPEDVDFVLKPFEPADLCSRVEQAIASS